MKSALSQCFTALLPIVLLLQCAGPQPTSKPRAGREFARPTSPGRMIQIINVSAYDPKERQRQGRSYSTNDVSALRDNGARGLIARAGKGGRLDTKCKAFLHSADRVGLLPGVYYRVQSHVGIIKQADQFVNRAFALKRSRGWKAPSLLLCGDYDGDLKLSAILQFMDRVEARTGVVPVAYLENSVDLKRQTQAADRKTRARLLRAPYWLALYSHTSRDPVFPPPGSPKGLVDQYALWPDWTLWQYGGVGWENGRSQAKVYHHGRYRFSRYFGNLDRPLERNVFKGSQAQLIAFWQRHGLSLR